MQPFNHSQQLPFRYFDSDIAKKRYPLVVSFRRIQKMAPSPIESSNSVSICDIHRLDTKLRDNNEVVTMKIMSKYGGKYGGFAMQKNNYCSDSQTCRNLASNDKQKSQLDSLFDEKVLERARSDKGYVFPKEKFHGNAKLLLSVNDDILRKAVINCDEDSFDQHVDIQHNPSRNMISNHHLPKDRSGGRHRIPFNNVMRRKLQTITSSPADRHMIDDDVLNCGGVERKNDFMTKEENGRDFAFRTLITANEKMRNRKSMESETCEKAFKSMNKSLSAPTFLPLKKLSTCMKRVENGEDSSEVTKSVSMLSLDKSIL